MSSNGRKVQKLQVDIIENRNDDLDAIEIQKGLIGTAEFPNEDPKSFIQRKDLEGLSGSDTLKPWVAADPAMTDQYRTYLIGAIEYLFRSTIDDNVNVPAFLGAPGAWTRTDAQYVPPAWNIGGNYNLGAYVDDGGNIYKSKVAGNIGHDPSADVDEDFWELIGINRGFYAAGPAYGLGDVIIDDEDGNRIYISNIAENEQPLSDDGSSSWQVIGPTSEDSPDLADGVVVPGVIEIDVDSLATFTSQFTYRLGGVVFTPVQADIQLDDPDPTYRRIDIIYGKNDGTYGFTSGIASATYETPLPPINTILLAKILRKPDNTNVISIIGTTGYVEQILAIIYGDTFHKYGSNIYMDAAEGTTDPGDIVFREWLVGVLTETARIYKATETTKELRLRFNGDATDEAPISRKVTKQYNQGDLVADGMGGYYLPVDVSVLAEKEIVSVKCKITGETSTIRIDASLIAEDSAWAPTIRIGGFTNNSPQTITIILI
jgi:hypothetical protein